MQDLKCCDSEFATCNWIIGAGLLDARICGICYFLFVWQAPPLRFAAFECGGHLPGACSLKGVLSYNWIALYSIHCCPQTVIIVLIEYGVVLGQLNLRQKWFCVF